MWHDNKQHCVTHRASELNSVRIFRACSCWRSSTAVDRCSRRSGFKPVIDLLSVGIPLGELHKNKKLAGSFHCLKWHQQHISFNQWCSGGEVTLDFSAAERCSYPVQQRGSKRLGPKLCYEEDFKKIKPLPSSANDWILILQPRI